MNAEDILERLKAEKETRAIVDAQNRRTKQALNDEWAEIAPSVFDTNNPFKGPIMGNRVAQMSKDMASQLAVIPNFTAYAPRGAKAAADERADEKTRIILSYLAASNYESMFLKAAHWWVDYGFLVSKVEPDFDRQIPVTRFLNPFDTYYSIDKWDNLTDIYEERQFTVSQLKRLYPEHEQKLNALKSSYEEDSAAKLNVIFHHNKDADTIVVSTLGADKADVLSVIPNKMGVVSGSIIELPNGTGKPKGMYAGLVDIMLAANQFFMASLQITMENAQAATVVDPSVRHMPTGPGAVIVSDNPNGIKKLTIGNIQETRYQQQALVQEMEIGGGYPSSRTGDTGGASIITGEGIRATQIGFNSSVKSFLNIAKRFHEDNMSISFMQDETYFGNIKKTVKGAKRGVPFSMVYTPNLVIRGDYTLKASYTLGGGFTSDGTRAMLQQLMASGLIGKKDAREMLGLELDMEIQEDDINLESLEQATRLGLSSLMQSVGGMLLQGQDPRNILKVVKKTRDGINQGKSIIDSFDDALNFETDRQPTPEELIAEQIAAMGAAGGMGGPGAPGGEQLGLPPGEQDQAPGSRPSLQTLVLGTDASGTPTNRINTSIRRAF